jgi:hypothetical protein
VLRVVITNHGNSDVKISGITYAFPGSSVHARAMRAVASFFSIYYADQGKATLTPNQSKTWSNGLVNLVPDDDSTQISNVVFLPEPIPSRIEIRVSCAGFADPATLELPLVAHRAPSAHGAYEFPYSVKDLRLAEYYVGSALHWANGGASGPQIFAHDLGCEGYDSSKQSWSRLLPGKDGSKNAHYRIWGKPIRAMADGKVIAFHDGEEANTVLGEFPESKDLIGSGNSVTLQHGSEKIIYCHMQKGSIPAALQQPDAHVKAGDIIGLVGNSGRADGRSLFAAASRAG